MKIIPTLVAAFAMAAPGIAAAAQAQAAAYPNRAVTIVVPYQAGGVADALPRMVGEKLGKKWGVPVIIKNTVGASGNIGMDSVAKAKPDGYTLALAPAGNLTVNPLLFTNLPFDTQKDFTPVTLLATSPNVLVVNSKLDVHTVKELVDHGKKHPDSLSYASPGVGSGAHLAGELFNQQAGLAMLHVPYGGMAPAVNDLAGGVVNVMFAGVSTVVPHIQSGKLRAIAIAGPQRLPVLPDVPTVSESGYPGFDVTSWYGLVAPAGTPEAAIQKLAADIGEVLKDQDIHQKFAQLGVTPSGIAPDAFAALIRDETEKWSDIVRKANIKPIQ
ncbi:Bug family tripartite tricarboxylate transporter substrate binding protein [Parapusillimonas granuli]|uniref:Tripartite tricarboxylate transporter substrate binding protein n=1 Tax=Parapusillimonas granuli TaxID=380911 RepID=A0A853GAC5_9BURK|nr:tripartite tricarboxylate transporter substrate binding protein [Parapusillimonas granuli]MBB5213355.1 tripartite-type tricarboxylate transporter receptor subunit TctC [Parapusillimonas granuli]MEB2398455.1 tripartite tricarboxylate transporter substrate binding protein [Alcaligenaceae bacterium]NYT51850.1 tripartite tricarboxylate transporter substrate binding protein [Parapusillimonas granuli]